MAEQHRTLTSDERFMLRHKENSQRRKRELAKLERADDKEVRNESQRLTNEYATRHPDRVAGSSGQPTTTTTSAGSSPNFQGDGNPGDGDEEESENEEEVEETTETAEPEKAAPKRPSQRAK